MTTPTPREALADLVRAHMILLSTWRSSLMVGGVQCESLEAMEDRSPELAAARAAPAVPAQPKASEILQAVARGWTHGPNQHKEMDADLGIAIAAEISALFDSVLTIKEDKHAD